MVHLKRNKVPKTWPIPRKGTKYVVVMKEGIEQGIPLLIAIRDILKYARKRKEVKYILNNIEVKINNKIVYDERRGLMLFDILAFPSIKEYYRLTINKNKKFDLEKINENEAKERIAKIENKKKIDNKTIQLNLLGGQNYIYDKDCKVGDSVIIDLEANKIKEIIPAKEGMKALVFEGKHLGQRGKIKKIDEDYCIISTEEGEDIKALIKHIIVVK